MSRSTILKFIVASIGILSSRAAFASVAGPGSVSNINAASTSDITFLVAGTRTAPPTCATNTRLVFKTNTPGGQAMLATMLTAYSQGRDLLVFGTGACTDITDSETVSYFAVVN